MAINFPTSPSNGDTVTEGNITYTYNATKGYWVSTESSGGGGSSVTVSDTAPTSPSDGDMWYNSLDLNLYVYYNDGTSSQWVQSAPQQAGADGDAGPSGAAGSPTSYANLAAFPSSGNTAGDMGFATDTKSSYMWDGTEWQRLSIGSQIGPRYTTSPPTTHDLNNDGTTATTITAVAIDESGFPITYDWDAYSGATVYSASSLPAQLTSVTESNGVFSLTGSSVQANAGSFVFRTKASDGVLFTPAISTVSLAFVMWTFSANINGVGSQGVTTPLSITEYGSWTVTVSEDNIFDVKMWGAAGAAAHDTLGHGVGNIGVAATSTDNFGGGGGFASGRMTLVAGQDYTIRVGQGGMRITPGGSSASNTYVTWLAGGMKTGYNTSAYMASGGGYSGIFTGTTAAQNDTILLAGGGGGGGSASYGRSGAGGGTTGSATTGAAQSGTSGTQTAGGSPASYNGATAGGALYGGTSGAYTNAQTHASGGGGYFGGGGSNAGGGGGGSGYASASVSIAILTSGSYNDVANSSDTDRGSAGSSSGLAGNNGKILFTVV
jgi:hypothetical protein